MSVAEGTAEALALNGLSKSFGPVKAVRSVAFDVRAGSICSLLGPSGCGKTTTLRMIAGLEVPDAGTVSIGERVLAGPGGFVPPEQRSVGMVFQDYALFPHLDVAENIAYGLGRKPEPGRVDEVLALVGLAGAGPRAVHELSGGEQQRVAVARALAPNPRLVLLDEPFSNLDASRRVELRLQVREILQAAGVTALFVTHDQEEALSLAEKVVVMNNGQVEQVGTPEEIYMRPANRWMAEFLGEIEVLPGTAAEGRATSEIGSLRVSGEFSGPVDILIRPESVAIGTTKESRGIRARIVDRQFYGHDQMLVLELASGSRIRSRRLGFPAWSPGDEVKVWVDGPADVLPRG